MSLNRAVSIIGLFNKLEEFYLKLFGKKLPQAVIKAARLRDLLGPLMDLVLENIGKCVKRDFHVAARSNLDEVPETCLKYTPKKRIKIPFFVDLSDTYQTHIRSSIVDLTLVLCVSVCLSIYMYLCKSMFSSLSLCVYVSGGGIPRYVSGASP